jgi:hypothetical protein
MNAPLRRVLFSAIALAFVVCLSCSFAHAQSPDASSATAGAIADTATSVVTPFIVTFAQSHPVVLTILAAIASLRLVFKPLMSAIEAFVKSSPSTDDDAVLENVEHSKAFKVLAYLLDWLGSVKVGPQFTAKPVAQVAAKD